LVAEGALVAGVEKDEVSFALRGWDGADVQRVAEYAQREDCDGKSVAAIARIAAKQLSDDLVVVFFFEKRGVSGILGSELGTADLDERRC
jgi:hypothetical protein